MAQTDQRSATSLHSVSLPNLQTKPCQSTSPVNILVAITVHVSVVYRHVGGNRGGGCQLIIPLASYIQNSESMSNQSGGLFIKSHSCWDVKVSCFTVKV